MKVPQHCSAFAAFLIFCQASPCAAQSAFGFRTGIGFCSMAFIDDSDGMRDIDLSGGQHRSAGPAVALLLDVPITQRFSMQPEVAFAQKGFMYDPDNAFSFFMRQKWTLDYLEAGMLGKYYLGSEPARVHVLMGASFGRLLGIRLREFGTNYDQVDALDPGALGADMWDFGLQGGAGFTFSAGNSWLFFEGRYTYGFSNMFNGLVFSDLNGSLIGELNGYNRGIMFNVGWMMPGCGGQVEPPAP